MTDTPIQPWTLKNVPPEQRSAAIKAAQRENQPVGVWVGRAVFEAAQKVLTASREVTVADPRAGAVVPQQQAMNGTAVGHLVPTGTQPAAPPASDAMSYLEGMLLMARIARDLNELPPDGPAAAFQKAALAKLKAQLKVS